MNKTIAPLTPVERWRGISIRVFGLCPLFIDYLNSRANFGMVDIKNHTARMTITEYDPDSGAATLIEPFQLDLYGNLRLTVIRPDDEKSKRITFNQFIPEKVTAKDRMISFKYIADLENLYDVQLPKDLSQLKAQFWFFEGEISCYSLLTTGEDEVADAWFVASDVTQISWYRQHFGPIADSIGVKIDFGPADSAQLYSGDNKLIYSFDSTKFYVIELSNNCLPENGVECDENDFLQLYSTLITLKKNGPIFPIVPEITPTMQADKTALCAPIVFGRTTNI